MRLKLIWFAATIALAAVGCEKDNKNQIHVNPEVQSAFEKLFPGATRVEWANDGAYQVADFRWEGNTASAWFTDTGDWKMTEIDIPYRSLPQAVRTAFESSDFRDWRIDDVDMLERTGMETVYVLEVEQGELDADLFYSEGGILLKVVTEADDDHSPSVPDQLPDAVKAYLAQHYPQARITDTDHEKQGIEVDILDGTTPRELLFSPTGEWLSTETDVTAAQVPQEVMQALLASEWGAWEIDDIDHIATPQGAWYDFEMEQGEREVHVRIAPDGTLL